MSSPTFVLVHGAWHDSTCWQQLAELLRAQGCSVSCPDLPGHGSNELPLQKVTLKKYVSALTELLNASAEPVVLVGHSMAGMVISEAACLVPQKVSALVYLCAYLPCDGQSLFDLIAINRSHEPFIPIEMAMEMSADKRSCSIVEEQIIPLFYTSVEPQLAATLKTRLSVQAALPLASAVKIEQDIFNTLNTCYISCTKDRVLPLHHQRRMLNRQSCKTLLQIEADHSPFYSCPQALAELLLAFSSD